MHSAAATVVPTVQVLGSAGFELLFESRKDALGSEWSRVEPAGSASFAAGVCANIEDVIQGLGKPLPIQPPTPSVLAKPACRECFRQRRVHMKERKSARLLPLCSILRLRRPTTTAGLLCVSRKRFPVCQNALRLCEEKALYFDGAIFGTRQRRPPAVRRKPLRLYFFWGGKERAATAIMHTRVLLRGPGVELSPSAIARLHSSYVRVESVSSCWVGMPQFLLRFSGSFQAE